MIKTLISENLALCCLLILAANVNVNSEKLTILEENLFASVVSTWLYLMIDTDYML